MRVKDCETLLLGSIKQIIHDKTYFYNSPVGIEYCHLTEEGQALVQETVKIFGSRLIKAMQQEDIDRSKKLVIDELSN